MVKKVNNNRIEDVESLSQLDYGGVIKDVHSFPGHYLRVRDALTIVKQHYDYLTATYNGSDPEQVKYYVGLAAHETRIAVGSDVAGSLNNKYFFLFEGRSNRKFHVWYNVNGAGVDPAPSNSTAIEVAINTNDPAAIVSYATELVINSSTFKEYFSARRTGTTLYVTANKLGVTNDSLDVDTGFTILNQQGASQLVQTVDIEYELGSPLFDGQVMTGYYYDVFSGAFTKKPELTFPESINTAVGGHQNSRIAIVSEDFLPTELNVSAFTEVIAYAPIEDLKVRVVKLNANTFGSFRLKINGDIKAYFQTSIMQRNCMFEFPEDLDVLNGDSLTIEFVPDRIQVLSNYNFFMRMESYVL